MMGTPGQRSRTSGCLSPMSVPASLKLTASECEFCGWGVGLPFRADVCEGIGTGDGKGDEDDVRLGVGQWSEALVVFLACGVPEGQLDGLAVDAAVGYVVFEDCGDVALLCC